MITPYKYEVRQKGKVIGYYYSDNIIYGDIQ